MRNTGRVVTGVPVQERKGCGKTHIFKFKRCQGMAGKSLGFKEGTFKQDLKKQELKRGNVWE